MKTLFLIILAICTGLSLLRLIEKYDVDRFGAFVGFALSTLLFILYAL